MNKFLLNISLSIAASACLISTPPLMAENNTFEQSMEKYLASENGQKAIYTALSNYSRKQQESMQKAQQEQASKQLEEQFKNPVKIAVGNSPLRGAKDAKVTIIEFSDFQCPFCKRGADTMDQIIKQYEGKVNIAFKNLPLPFHQQAMPAAKAALAAQKQGKFWEMHEALFANQNKLGDEFYLEEAKTLGLDVEKFKKDMESEEVKKQIEEDSKLARDNGIQGTPGYFVNGVAIKGAVPIDQFKSVIDRWLNGNVASKQS